MPNALIDVLENPWVASVLIVVLAFSLVAVVRGVVLARLERLADKTDNDLDDRLVHLAKSLLGVVVFFSASLLILDLHQVKLTPFLAGAGIIGIAIGFAAKETLADILAGIFLITDRPMRVGDRVKLEFIGRDWGGWGDVLDVGLRRTKVRNTDGVVVNYPNSILATSVITNFTEERGPIRVRVRFQVDYDADVTHAMAISATAIAAVEGVLPDTTQVVTRSIWDPSRGHTTAGVLLEGRYRIIDVRKRTGIRSNVLVAVLAALKAEGVPFPAPRIQIAGTPSPE